MIAQNNSSNNRKLNCKQYRLHNGKPTHFNAIWKKWKKKILCNHANFRLKPTNQPHNLRSVNNNNINTASQLFINWNVLFSSFRLNETSSPFFSKSTWTYSRLIAFFHEFFFFGCVFSNINYKKLKIFNKFIISSKSKVYNLKVVQKKKLRFSQKMFSKHC